MKVIVASTYEQAIIAAGMLELPPEAWRYGRTVQDLRGVEAENIIVVEPHLEHGYIDEERRFEIDTRIAYIERTRPGVKIQRVNT